MSIVRKIRTFAFIASRRPSAAWELLQIRAERRFGVPLYFMSLGRLSTYVFEVASTKRPADLVAYGNYFLDPRRLPANPVVLSLGIGIHAEFDEAVLERHPDVRLIMVDPTPASKVYVDGLNLPANAQFFPVAVTDYDGTIDLFTGDLSADFNATTSVSIYNRGFFADSVKAECRKFTTLMKDAGVDRVDVLKMDIEGAGLLVLSDMLEAGIAPGQIACELERPEGLAETAKYLRKVANLFDKLRSLGYSIYRTRPQDHGCQIEISAIRTELVGPA